MENEPLQFQEYFCTSLNNKSLRQGPGEYDEQYILTVEYTYNWITACGTVKSESKLLNDDLGW